MKRYIDADALLERLPDDLPYKGSVKRVLIQAPAADVVERWEFDVLDAECSRLERFESAGYDEVIKAKAEIAREIFAELEVKAPFLCENQKAYEVFMMELAKLKQEYGVE